jgi:ABC-2 type transport system permease protein
MNPRIEAMVLRYLLVFRRSYMRMFDVVFWPIVDLLVWGYVTKYLQGLANLHAISFIVGSMILWDLFFRAQQAVTMGILQEMWVGNLLNIFVSPLKMWEFLSATAIMGLIRATITAVLLGVLAYLLYAFNVLVLPPSFMVYVALLFLFGWVMGVFAMSIILRYGEAAENFAWIIPFMIQPFCAVFYPVTTLPFWLQGVAYAIPGTYVFEGLRAALSGAPTSLSFMCYGAIVSAAYMVFALMYFGRTLRVIKQKGYLTRGVRT